MEQAKNIPHKDLTHKDINQSPIVFFSKQALNQNILLIFAT